MATTQEVHVGDIGTIFRVTLYDGTSVVDLSSATEKLLVFQKPNRDSVAQTAAFYTDGTDGILQYQTVTDDLDMSGAWSIQAVVTLSSGKWSSSVGTFTVYDNISYT